MAELQPCRVCGKMFKPCNTCIKGMMNWRSVACSSKCGKKYFTAILESRKTESNSDVKQTK